MAKTLGRPATTQQELDDMYAKLRPHLEGGLSMRKACENEGVTRSVVIKYMGSDADFATKITTAQRYKSIKMGYITSNMLGSMADALKEAIDAKRSVKEVFSPQQYAFLRYVMSYDRSIREEYGADEQMSPEDTQPVAFGSPRNEREAELQLRVLNKHADYVRAKRNAKVKDDDDGGDIA